MQRRGRRCWLKNGSMRINKSSDSGNQEEKTWEKTQLQPLVTVCWFSGADSVWVFRPFQVCSQANKKATVFFWCVKRNDSGMELLLRPLKSQQNSINKF